MCEYTETVLSEMKRTDPNMGTEFYALLVLHKIELLCHDEGASVLICCPNPDWNDLGHRAIEVCDVWTEYKERRFEGDTLYQCLLKAALAKSEADAAARRPPGEEDGR